MEVQLKVDDLKKFFYAGKAKFSVKNTMTGNRIVYYLEESKDGAAYFVKVLMGQTYVFIGIVTAKDGTFKRTPKSNLADDHILVKAFEYCNRLARTEIVPPNIVFSHLGKCGKCGHPLTDDKSIIIGLGPNCNKKLKIDK